MKKAMPKAGGGRKAPAREAPEEDRRRLRLPRQLTILYEDDAVIALDKPAGLLAVPIPGSQAPSALVLLNDRLRPRRQKALVVHRIDRFASGALLFAKTVAAREVLVRQFLDHVPLRQYLAVLRGSLERENGTLVHYFRRQGMYQQERKSTDPHATRAELHFAVEGRFAEATLVRVELVTGLQNQIRAQFAVIGHPLIGDRKYHREESHEPLIARVALHAAYLEFDHPITGEPVGIECDPPADFRLLLHGLEKAESASGKAGQVNIRRQPPSQTYGRSKRPAPRRK